MYFWRQVFLHVFERLMDPALKRSANMPGAIVPASPCVECCKNKGAGEGKKGEKDLEVGTWSLDLVTKHS